MRPRVDERLLRRVAALGACTRRLGSSASGEGRKLVDVWPKEVVDDVYKASFKRQTGVSLKCVCPPLSRLQLCGLGHPLQQRH